MNKAYEKQNLERYDDYLKQKFTGWEMNLKRQKTVIKNRKYTGGKKDVTYFTKKLNEFGLKVPKYLENNTISQKQFKSLQKKAIRKINQ